MTKINLMATKKRHYWIVRVTHWVNIVAIIIMVGTTASVTRFSFYGDQS